MNNSALITNEVEPCGTIEDEHGPSPVFYSCGAWLTGVTYEIEVDWIEFYTLPEEGETVTEDNGDPSTGWLWGTGNLTYFDDYVTTDGVATFGQWEMSGCGISYTDGTTRITSPRFKEPGAGTLELQIPYEPGHFFKSETAPEVEAMILPFVAPPACNYPEVPFKSGPLGDWIPYAPAPVPISALDIKYDGYPATVIGSRPDKAEPSTETGGGADWDRLTPVPFPTGVWLLCKAPKAEYITASIPFSLDALNSEEILCGAPETVTSGIWLPTYIIHRGIYLNDPLDIGFYAGNGTGDFYSGTFIEPSEVSFSVGGLGFGSHRVSATEWEMRSVRAKVVAVASGSSVDVTFEAIPIMSGPLKCLLGGGITPTSRVHRQLVEGSSETLGPITITPPASLTHRGKVRNLQSVSVEPANDYPYPDQVAFILNCTYYGQSNCS